MSGEVSRFLIAPQSLYKHSVVVHELHLHLHNPPLASMHEQTLMVIELNVPVNKPIRKTLMPGPSQPRVVWPLAMLQVPPY